MDKELIAEVTIPQYIRKVMTTKSRRESYYYEGENIPLKYFNGLNILYHYIPIDKGEVLADMEGNLILKNPESAGKAKYKLINGQSLHTLQLKDYERSQIIKAIKAQMIPEVEKLGPIEVKPIRILCELYDTVEDIEINRGENKSWDVDNRILFYSKVFQDVLSGSPMIDKKTKKIIYTSKRIIPNDNVLYVTQAPSPIFIPIDNSEDRKLVFKIYHDLRSCITSNKFYQ